MIRKNIAACIVSGVLSASILSASIYAEGTDAAQETEKSIDNSASEENDKAASEEDEQISLTPDDYMFFTFDDGVKYRLRMDYVTDFDLGNLCFVAPVIDGEVNENGGFLLEDLTNYIFRKYFYNAKRAEEGKTRLEIPEIDVKDLVELEDNQVTVEYFKWDEQPCEFDFVFGSDSSEYSMYYEEGTIKVGKKSENGEIREILAFDDNAKEETEFFINESFVNARGQDDDEFMWKLEDIILADERQSETPTEETQSTETNTAEEITTYTDKNTIMAVQEALNKAGYSCGTPDGVAGTMTNKAIIDFKTAQGMADADSTITDALLQALGI